MTVHSSGLGEAVAKARLLEDGPNELPRSNQRTALRIFLEVIREPMLALLIGGGVVYLALGDVKEAIILLVFACASVLITVVQEARTERVLDALRDLTSPRALVVRDGERKRIAGREVVRGDLIILSEGDRVPADARLLSAQNLEADESLLTGESVPVRKREAPMTPVMTARPGGDDLPFVYSGSLIVRGAGEAEVLATGPRSEIGKIGQSLGQLETAAPHLQIQTRKLSLSSPSLARPSACSSSCSTEPCAAAGSMQSSRASRLAWRCCRRSSLLSLPCSWRWAHGGSRRPAF
jgi:Ca2+-transporting ATPase